PSTFQAYPIPQPRSVGEFPQIADSPQIIVVLESAFHQTICPDKGVIISFEGEIVTIRLRPLAYASRFVRQTPVIVWNIQKYLIGQRLPACPASVKESDINVGIRRQVLDPSLTAGGD